MVAPQYVEWLVRLLAFIGGAASTVVGSWVSSKIHVYHGNRNAHRDELKEKVLCPLRDCLDHDFERLVKLKVPVVDVLWMEVALKESARSTEAQTEQGEVLTVANPWPVFRGTTDAALYQDVKIKHFSEVIAKVEEFASAWEGYAENLREWIQEMSQEILRASGIPPLNHGASFEGYAAHNHLAVFVYKRTCGLQAGSLEKRSTGNPRLWSLMNESVSVAMSSWDKLDGLIKTIDALLVAQQAKGRLFVDRARQLATQLDAVKSQIRLAIASRRLRKRCDLVTFF